MFNRSQHIPSDQRRWLRSQGEKLRKECLASARLLDELRVARLSVRRGSELRYDLQQRIAEIMTKKRLLRELHQGLDSIFASQD